MQRTPSAPLMRKPLGDKLLKLFLSGLLIAQLGCHSNPKPSFLAQPEFQLTGYWLKEGLMEGSAILLSSPLDQRYPVRFSYAGCVEADIRRISAVFEAGYLRLSEPVREYSGPEFDRLALFQRGQESYLVPVTLLTEFKDPKVK